MIKRFCIGMAIAAFLAPVSLAQQSTYNPQAEFKSFESQFGGPLGTYWNEFGFVEMIYGNGGEMRLNSLPVTDAEFETSARGIFDAYPGMFGYDSGALVLDKVWRLELSDIGTTDKVAVTFKQEVRGVPVYGGWATVLFDLNGRILSVDNGGLPDVQGKEGLLFPRISEVQASTFARETFGQPIGEIRQADFVIFKGDFENELVARPAWMFELRAAENGPDNIPVQEQIVVDAETGQILDQKSTIYHVDLTGNTEGWVTPGDLPDTGANPEVLAPVGFARMTSGVGNSNTALNGNWTIPYGGNTVQNVSVNFNSSSTYAYVVDESGAEISLSQNVTPGVPSQFTMNGARTEHDTAEMNAQRHIITFREYIKSISPSDNTFDFRVRANVNINSNCNAYWDGSSINFYTSGGGCANTAYSTVVAHEEGHWAVSRYQGGASGAFHEGCADIWAMYIFDTNIVGRNFCGSGCHIRNGNNGRNKCNGCNESCNGGAVHTEGQVIMGAFWEMRENLNNSLGDVAGDAVSDDLFLGWLQAYNDSTICDIIYTHVLIVDDNDGNLGNGTPHCADIEDAFENEKGWPDLHSCSGPPQDCPAPCNDATTYGSGSAGSGGFTPVIGTINGCSYLGNQNFAVTVDSALGGATGSMLIGFSSANVNQGGWTRLVNQALVISLSYSGAGAGNGSVQVPLAIPNNPFLNGFNVYFQAIVIDPGSSGGVAATNGLNSVLCRPN